MFIQRVVFRITGIKAIHELHEETVAVKRQRTVIQSGSCIFPDSIIDDQTDLTPLVTVCGDYRSVFQKLWYGALCSACNGGKGCDPFLRFAGVGVADKRGNENAFPFMQDIGLIFDLNSAAALFCLQKMVERISFGAGYLFLFTLISDRIKRKRLMDGRAAKINGHKFTLFRNVILFSLTYYTSDCPDIV